MSNEQTETIARRLVALCREGKFSQAHDELYAPNARSIEVEGNTTGPLGNVEGLDAIRAKGREFDQSYEQVHHLAVSEPLIAGNFFTCTMTIDATWKGRGRSAMDEICVYETEGGKIVREQFFYGMG